jgi:hypothetical protein
MTFRKPSTADSSPHATVLHWDITPTPMYCLLVMVCLDNGDKQYSIFFCKYTDAFQNPPLPIHPPQIPGKYASYFGSFCWKSDENFRFGLQAQTYAITMRCFARKKLVAFFTSLLQLRMQLGICHCIINNKK